MTAPKDANKVLSALRLGWYVAEVRGRNWPGGPPGASDRMPDHADHALPLRTERSSTELRIEAQAVITQLAVKHDVADSGDGVNFCSTIEDQAKQLASFRAQPASDALQRAAELLRLAVLGQASPGGTKPPTVIQVIEMLQEVLDWQEHVLADRAEAVTHAQQVAAATPDRAVSAALQSAQAQAEAVAQVATETAAVRHEQAITAGQQTGIDVLRRAIAGLQQAIAMPAAPAVAAASAGPAAPAVPAEPAAPAVLAVPAAPAAAAAPAVSAAPAVPTTPEQVGLARIQECRRTIANVPAVHQRWTALAELLWRFDAHIQDHLAAVSETQACGYQLGRGLAETYWSLDPSRTDGSEGWSFLLGEQRCAELSRLAGRLGTYMGEYTAPAIAGSVEVWKEVATTPTWRGDALADVLTTDQDLYRQIRRWYELIVLGQDPTTLIQPLSLIKNYQTVWRALRFFWPQLVGTIIGLGALGTLLALLSLGSGSSLARSLSGLLAAVGLSFAGITGQLKNSAQAMLKRLRQDAYTDLVADAVLTAPAAPKKSMTRKAISRRTLTSATSNAGPVPRLLASPRPAAGR